MQHQYSQVDQIIIKRHKTYAWRDVFNAWHAAIVQGNALPNPLFAEIRIKGTTPKTAADTPDFVWPETEQLTRVHMDLQQYHDEAPFNTNTTCGYDLDKDVHTTVMLLWQHANDIEKTAAVLITASLTPYVIDRKQEYPTAKWPPYHEVMRIVNQATEVIGIKGIRSIYSRQTTQTMPLPSPYRQPDEMILINPLHMAIELASMHAQILKDNRPARILFSADGDPGILALLKQRHDHQLELRAQEQRKEDEKQRKEEEKRRDCPLYGQWPHITMDQLKKLVYEKSALKIAGLYGVSDVAVAKKCRQMNIPKPGRGYWAKAAAAAKKKHARQGDKR